MGCLGPIFLNAFENLSGLIENGAASDVMHFRHFEHLSQSGMRFIKTPLFQIDESQVIVWRPRFRIRDYGLSEPWNRFVESIGTKHGGPKAIQSPGIVGIHLHRPTREPLACGVVVLVVHLYSRQSDQPADIGGIQA